MATHGNFVRPIGDLQTASMTVGTKPTPIATKDGKPMRGRRGVIIYVPSGASVVLGNSEVTTSTGLPLTAGDTYIIPTVSMDSDLCLVASSSTSVNVAEFTE